MSKTQKNTKPEASFELVTDDTGLTKEQLVQAHELHAKFPAIVAAYTKVKEQENNLRGKWLTLCERLREPGDGVTLNSREMNLILRGLGEPKSRVSEIIKVVSVDDKVWSQYKANVIGFRAVLKLARGNDDAETPAETNEGESEGKDEKGKEKPVIKTIPPTYANIIANTLADDPKQWEPTGSGYYELVYVTPCNGHGRKFTVTIEIDDIAKN